MNKIGLNTQRIASRYRTRTFTVIIHGANHTTLSDVVGMSWQLSFATFPSVVLSETVRLKKGVILTALLIS